MSDGYSVNRVEPCEILVFCTPVFKLFLKDKGVIFLKGNDKMSEMNELQTLRHSASHVMAQAVKRLFPDVKLAIGPAIDTGFYYDYDTEHTFTPEDLEKI